MNNVIIEQLVKPVKIELSNTTILDGRDDSWWNTPEYWEEKELDGVRSIIFYSISDSTKVLDAVKLHLTEDPKSFNYHDEVSSLLVKIAHQFPNECLGILTELLDNYEPGMKLFAPYGDVIYKFLFDRLPKDQIDKLQDNLVGYLAKEDFEFYNWAPMFSVLYRKGDNKHLKKVIIDNQERFKPVDSQGYYSVIIQAKAKVYGYETYSELSEVIETNQENNDRTKFALYAIQSIGINHELSQNQVAQIKEDLAKYVTNELDVEVKKTIQLIEGSK